MVTRKKKTKTSVGRPVAATRLTPKKRAKFLKSLAETGNVSEAAKSIGASRPGLYKARDLDENLARAWDSALETASDTLIAEVRRRGLEGFEEELHYQGELTGDVVTKYSDVLLIFLVKGLRPEFRDSKGVSVAVATEGRATVVFESNGREVLDE